MRSNLLFIVSVFFIVSVAIVSNHTSGYAWVSWILYIGYGGIAVHTAPNWVTNIVVGLTKVILAIIVLFAIFILSLFVVPCVLLEKKKCKKAQ